MHEGVARGDADGLVGGVEIHARGLGGDQRLAAGEQVGGGQVVGHHLEYGGRAQGAGVQDSPPHGGEQRQDALEGGAFTAGEDGDVAGVRAVTAAGDRAVHGLAAQGRTFSPRRRTSDSSVVDISIQILPGPMPSSRPSGCSSTAAEIAGVTAGR